jgi:hypothetical protein
VQYEIYRSQPIDEIPNRLLVRLRQIFSLRSALEVSTLTFGSKTDWANFENLSNLAQWRLARDDPKAYLVCAICAAAPQTATRDAQKMRIMHRQKSKHLPQEQRAI